MSCADLGRFSALYSTVIYAPIFKRDPAAFRVYVLLVHEAAYADKTVRRWNGFDFELGRGEVVASQAWLSENSGCSRKVIRRTLDDLEAAGFVRASKGPAKHEKRASKGANKGTVFLVCDYSDLYAPKEKKGQQKGQRCAKKIAKKGQQTPNHSSLCINTNTHIQNAREDGVCVSSFDEGKPASQPAEQTSTDPDTIPATDAGAEILKTLWNASVIDSGIPEVLSLPPARLDAAKAALRANNRLSWWRDVFRAAGQTAPLPNTGWVPTFDWTIKGINAARILEGQFPKKKARYRHKIFSEKDFPS